jgi:hypothetical protein
MEEAMTDKLTDEQLREWLASLAPLLGTNPVTTYREIRLIDEAIEAHRACCDPQTIGGLIEDLLEWRALMYHMARRNKLHGRIRNAALEDAVALTERMYPEADDLIDAMRALKADETT